MYSQMVGNMTRRIKRRHETEEIGRDEARAEISAMQSRLRSSLLVPGSKQRRVR